MTNNIESYLIDKIKNLKSELAIFTNINVDGNDNLTFDILVHYGYLKGSIDILEEILTNLNINN